MHTQVINFPWAEELEKTVVSSLATSFGLDFILFEDKLGGNVDTIHNAREGIWGTDKEKQRYDQRSNYKDVKDAYHSHENYKSTGKRDKQLKEEGKLHDPYRNKVMGADEKRNLDHVISAKEVDSDPGVKLAEIDGVELANQSSNLQTTQETVNKSKSSTSIDEYLNKLPNLLETHEKTLLNHKKRLARIPLDTPEQKHKAQEIKDKIKNTENKIKQLESIDPKEMRKRDAEARASYNAQINQKYYASSKFMKQTAIASGIAGVKMGARQMFGLVLAEIWFELREQIPEIFEKIKQKFDLGSFFTSINEALQGIWKRIKARFKDFLISFKDGVFAGVFSSATTTLFNVFATTQKMAIKLIREMWGQLVKAIKLIAFNPDKLSFVDLCKAALSILSVGVAASIGTVVHAQLLPLCGFPFGSAAASFVSALVTGVVTLGLNYFLIYSDIAKKLWVFVESIMPHASTVKKYQAINFELDNYLADLGRIEFGVDIDELESFSLEFDECSDEAQRSMLLCNEIAKREIELPFEMGESISTRNWLVSKV